MMVVRAVIIHGNTSPMVIASCAAAVVVGAVVAGAGVAGVAAAIQALQRRTPSIMVGETRENSKLYFEMTKKK